MRLLTGFFFALLSLGTPLSAQLVTKGLPSPAAKSRHVPRPHASPKGLQNYGITPRALWSEKRVGENDSLTFNCTSFAREDWTDHGMTVYKVYGRDPFSETSGKINLGEIRISKQGPEYAKHPGGPWTLGEKDHDTWLFALDQDTIRLDPMDEEFTPVSFKALAFERGIDVKTGGTLLESQRTAPIFHTAVVAFAFGRNEFQGTIKYPGASFVVSFQGVHYKDRWIGRSTSKGPFNIIVNRPIGYYPASGAKLPDTGNTFTTQIDLDQSRILIGVGPLLNYALPGEPADQLTTACVFDLNKGQSLPDLANRYREMRSSSTWSKADEVQSFSREAERAYATLGKKVWFWAPLEGRRVFQSWKDQSRAFLESLVDRVKAFGGTAGLLGYDGEPLLAPTSSQNRAEGSSSYTSTPAPRFPAFPLAVFGHPDHLITIHMAGEIRVWSPDRATYQSRSAIPLGELLTSGAAAPDGKEFVTTGNAAVRLWDASSIQCLRDLPIDGCRGWWCAAYSPDGRIIAAGGNDGKTRLWDAQTGSLIAATSKGFTWGFSLTLSASQIQRPEFVSSIAFSPDGKRLAEGTASGELRVWGLSNPGKPNKIKIIDLGSAWGKVFRLRFLHGGTELLVLDQAGSFKILDCQSWHTVRKADSALPTTTSVVFSPDEVWMITAHEGGRVVRTNLTTGTIDSDRQVSDVSIGVLTLANGHVLILGNHGWKPVDM